METSEKVKQLKNIENEIRGILQGNARIDSRLLETYRILLHKTRVERLTLQIESLTIKSARKDNSASILKTGEVEVKQGGLFTSKDVEKLTEKRKRDLDKFALRNPQIAGEKGKIK
jgi:hypothetical protein